MRGTRSTKGQVAMAVLAAVALVGAGCGDDDEVQRGVGDQPAPGTDTFEQGLFDEVPRYPRSGPLGPRSEAEESDVVAQSFAGIDVLPEDLLAFYAQELPVAAPPWEQLRGPEQIGAGTWRGTWVRDAWQLTVSAQEAPSLDDALGPDAAQGTFYSQYSLTLEPR